MRVVMWSGPRNLSTAMMRSFGARADTSVVDEPFYAAYLALSGVEHPMRDEILASGEADPAKVAAACAREPGPGEPPVRYEKHMTHHMLPNVPLGWTKGAAQAFLIRDPALVAASYAAKREAFDAADLGFERQAELFERAADRKGAAPPVIDAADVRRDPEATLRGLCRALGLAFDKAMLSWPAGPRATDGIWARHWYASVDASTGFAPPEDEGSRPELPPEAARIVEGLRPCYEALARHALRAR